MTDQPNHTPDGETPAGDPELAALVQRKAPSTDAAPVDASPTFETFDAVPVQPVAAAFDPPAPPRRRRSLKFRFGVSFAMGFVLAFGIGVGA